MQEHSILTIITGNKLRTTNKHEPPCVWRLGRAVTGLVACADWCVTVRASCLCRPGSVPPVAGTLVPAPDCRTHNASWPRRRRSSVPVDPSTPAATAVKIITTSCTSHIGHQLLHAIKLHRCYCTSNSSKQFQS